VEEHRSVLPGQHVVRGGAAPRRARGITHNHDNHGVRSEGWRYIRYADGSEELYDMRKDPNEWRNLATDPEMADVLEKHRGWLPTSSAKPAPGSRHRILTYDDGVTVWQGEEIGPDDPIPEI
jgi:arylsulfatase A-like enzyme